jgi:hypothetical protein
MARWGVPNNGNLQISFAEVRDLDGSNYYAFAVNKAAGLTSLESDWRAFLRGHCRHLASPRSVLYRESICTTVGGG